MASHVISNLLKYLPLAIGIAILSIGAFFVPWSEVAPYFSRLTLGSYVAIFALGTAYYIAKIIRYYYMLGVLKTHRSFRQTVLAYFIAQPASLLPAGEAYRIVTLKQHVNVPQSKGASIVFIQSFTENIALVLLALISATILNRQILIVFVLLLLYAMIFMFLRTRRTAEKGRSLINRLPFVSLAKSKYYSFIKKNRTLLSGKSLVIIFLSGFASSLIAVTLLFIVANDLDIRLGLTQATIAFVLPMVLQNVSFLPGGIGINEQGSVGVLVLMGAALPAAVALTLVMRFVTLVLGVSLGFVSMFVARVK